MEKKVTQKELFVKVIEKLEEIGELELANGMKQRLEKLNNKTRKLTSTQIENIEIGKKIIQVITENGKAMSITELMQNDQLHYSNQKLSAICSRLINEENPKLKREVGKNKRITFDIIKEELPEDGNEPLEDGNEIQEELGE